MGTAVVRLRFRGTLFSTESSVEDVLCEPVLGLRWLRTESGVGDRAPFGEAPSKLKEKLG